MWYPTISKPAWKRRRRRPGRPGAAARSTWTLDSLAPAHTKTWQLNCTCVKEAAKACNRVTVTADGGPQAGDESCLEIYTTADAAAPAAAAPAGKLTATIAEQADPIRVGSDTIYQIVLTNAGSTPQQQVVLSVKISEELRLIAIPTSPVTGHEFPAASPLQAGGRNPAGRVDHVRAADPGR